MCVSMCKLNTLCTEDGKLTEEKPALAGFFMSAQFAAFVGIQMSTSRRIY